MDRFAGRYLGTVVDNDDPKGLCRIKVRVPEVFRGETSGWCLPSAPYAGPGAGFAAVPPVGAMVFVEWPAGDVTRVPIWSGGVWADGEGVEGAGPEVIILLTTAGNRVELRDSSGDEAIEITSVSGAKVALDSDGALIEFGSQKVALTRSSISFNDGALEVK
jgi:uncharacterized protein involved in type VI secretion and phage assembly